MKPNVTTLVIRIVSSLLLLTIPFIGDYIVKQSSAVGPYYVAYFIVTCISITLFIFKLDNSLVKFVQHDT